MWVEVEVEVEVKVEVEVEVTMRPGSSTRAHPRRPTRSSSRREWMRLHRRGPAALIHRCLQGASDE